MTNQVRTETPSEYHTSPPASERATVLKKAFNPETGIEYQIEMPADDVPTTRRKALNPETGAEYEIQMPTREVVKQAILDLEWPPDGRIIVMTTTELGDDLGLSEAQKTAVNSTGFNLFRHALVAPLFRELLEEGVLEQPGGDKTPYFLVDAHAPVNGLFPDEPLEGDYEALSAEIAKALLQQIDEKTVGFVEKTVVYSERSGVSSSLKWDTGVRLRMPRRLGKVVSVEITLSL